MRKDVLSYADLAGRVRSSAPRLTSTRLVAIDGPAGSGKTTLASGLEAVLPEASVVHMDDLYLGWDTDFAEVHGRIRRQIIDPLVADRPARYQRYDWYAGQLADWIDVPVPGVLILEGVGSGARALEAVLSLLIWIEVGPKERVRRGVERDGEQVLPLWRAWMRHEAIEHERQDTRRRADLRLSGEQSSGQLPVVQPGAGR